MQKVTKVLGQAIEPYNQYSEETDNVLGLYLHLA